MLTLARSLIVEAVPWWLECRSALEWWDWERQKDEMVWGQVWETVSPVMSPRDTAFDCFLTWQLEAKFCNQTSLITDAMLDSTEWMSDWFQTITFKISWWWEIPTAIEWGKLQLFDCWVRLRSLRVPVNTVSHGGQAESLWGKVQYLELGMQPSIHTRHVYSSLKVMQLFLLKTMHSCSSFNEDTSKKSVQV